MNYPQQITMIDDLPDLDEIAQQGYYNPHDQPGPDVTGYIRPQYQPPPAESGMVSQKKFGYNTYGSAYKQNSNMPSRNMPQIPPENYEMINNPYPFAPENSVRENYVGSMGNCLDVSQHVENCPICSKIYKHDKTIMIITIVILAIICILLLKKVLNL